MVAARSTLSIGVPPLGKQEAPLAVMQDLGLFKRLYTENR